MLKTYHFLIISRGYVHCVCVMCCCGSLPDSMPGHVTDQPWREHVDQGSQQVLQIKTVFVDCLYFHKVMERNINAD
jgi:hypothetical protein